MNIINCSELTPELARSGCMVKNMPNEDYHAYEGISKSGLDKIAKSPAHFMFDARKPAKRNLELGTALHTAVLEPNRYKEEYVILNGIKARTASEYKQAVKVHGSELVLIENEAAHIASIQETAFSQIDIASELVGCDLFELSGFKEINGVLCRIRIDALNSKDRIIVDLKTTQSSARDEFSKSVFNYRYHVQDAFYSMVYEAITGEPLEAFKFLAVENEPPHCPMVYELDQEAKQYGLQDAMRDLLTFKRASDSQEWKGYEQTNEPLTLPNWALARYETELEEGIV